MTGFRTSVLDKSTLFLQLSTAKHAKELEPFFIHVCSALKENKIKKLNGYVLKLDYA